MIILTGKIQSGKSTLAMKLAIYLKQKGKRVSGVIAKGLWKNNLRHGFDLLDLFTNSQTPLARRKEIADIQGVTRFKFFDSGLEFGARALDYKKCHNSEIIFVDEIGKLELAGGGWASLLKPLLSIKTAVHIWIVRENLIDDVCKSWKLDHVTIANVNEKNILNKLKCLCG